jgi:transcriptional regulator with XRE-family HTH domain
MFMKKEEFAEILNVLMIEKGIDQAELARRTKATEQSVKRWVKGESSIKHSTLHRIAKGLDVSPEIFIPAFDIKKRDTQANEVKSSRNER